jgi:hypothetical protein
VCPTFTVQYCRYLTSEEVMQNPPNRTWAALGSRPGRPVRPGKVSIVGAVHKGETKMKTIWNLLVACALLVMLVSGRVTGAWRILQRQHGR